MSDQTSIFRGSFYWYLFHSGGFVKAIARAIQQADPTNLARLEQAFPQMVAAFRHSSWYEAPPEFEPHYQAPWRDVGR